MTRTQSKIFKRLTRDTNLKPTMTMKVIRDLPISELYRAEVYKRIMAYSSGFSTFQMQEKIGLCIDNEVFIKFCFAMNFNFTENHTKSDFKGYPQLWNLNNTIWKQEFNRLNKMKLEGNQKTNVIKKKYYRTSIPITRSKSKMLKKLKNKAMVQIEDEQITIKDIKIDNYDKVSAFYSILEHSSGLYPRQIQDIIKIGVSNPYFMRYCMQEKINIFALITPCCFKDNPDLWELNHNIWKQEFDRIMNL